MPRLFMLYLTSDHHFFHRNIIEYCNRPFKDIGHMNMALISRWNEVVKPADEVIHLGDFAMTNEVNHQEIFEQLNGTKHIVIGNHDRSYDSLKRIGWKILARYRQSFMLDEFELVHRPEDHVSDRAILYGHLHEKIWDNPRSLNVSVEVHNYYPISLENIRKRFE